MSSTLAIHWTVTTHGTWLHGDPRGSWKNGRLIGHDPILFAASSQSLANDAEKLSAEEVDLVAESFGATCLEQRHRVLDIAQRAVHLVI
jgi:hypothetical protein